MKKDTHNIAQRFRVAKKTLIIDKGMRVFIKVGGLGVVLSVAGIFFFILAQILPLFKGAEVVFKESIPTRIPAQIIAVDADPWSELPVAITKEGVFYFIDRKNGNRILSENPFAKRAIIPTSITYDQEANTFAAGTVEGKLLLGSLEYKTEFPDGKTRKVSYSITLEEPLQLEDHKAIDQVAIGIGEHKRLIAAIQGAETSSPQIHIVQMGIQSTLFDEDALEITGQFKLRDELEGRVKILVVAKSGEDVAIADEEGRFYYFKTYEDKIIKEQVLRPFGQEKIASLGFIFGDVSIVATSERGENIVLSLYVHPQQGNKRLFGKIHTFDKLPQADHYFFSKSTRNKAFLIGSGQMASLRYATTEKVLWESKLDFEPTQALIFGKYDGILFTDAQNVFHFYTLNNPHPESSFKAFFGKLWYEGASQRNFVWQSSSANEDFEPKLSMVPLIWGSIKGTIFALLFAIPIALAAAIYTSEFLEPKFKNIIKPAMEIMASLPSVVLGFLAALYIAPLIEDKFPSILVILLLVPTSVLLMGTLWSNQPYAIRKKIKPGYEYLLFAPLLLAIILLGWELGAMLEKFVFVVDEGGGVKTADFRLWFQTIFGATYEQRNTLVIGFMMGFAVLPIIFTVAEDVISNVPQTFRSGAFALGASRWQTVYSVVLPSAMAGIFAAIMIGFGRAVGETMIVVMATGNTPIIDFNIFTGMRTLSANIAVELPEAPQGGTLYRALYLGAFLLFAFTFMINTASEILRQRFRKRYLV